MYTVLLTPGVYPIVVNKYIIKQDAHTISRITHRRLPVPVAARSKVWVCVRLPAVIVGSNPTEGMDV
jgi:hypothetical protein